MIHIHGIQNYLNHNYECMVNRMYIHYGTKASNTSIIITPDNQETLKKKMEESTLRVKDFMRIGYDAKRVFHNWRGLGNYSRDLVLGLSHYFPSNKYILYSMDFKDDRSITFEKENDQFLVKKPQTVYENYHKFNVIY